VIKGFPKAKRAYYIRFNRIEDYKLIKEIHESDKSYKISFLCNLLGISRSAYYKWLNHRPSVRELEDEKILSKIQEVAKSNNSLFGAMNMYYTLKNKYGYTCGHNKVYRIMCINDIKSNYRRKSRYKYKANIPEETSENILNRDFNSSKPNEKWCTDVTEIKIPSTGEKLYISPVIDLYDRYPVGISVSERNDTMLTDSALESAHASNPLAKPIYHSDRGFQYTRRIFKNKLESYGMIQSMSRVSKCIDNGPCESFQGIFKDILFILYPNITSKEEMIHAIYGTLDYYINEYPQKRFNGKTCGQVRSEALNNNSPVVYPINKSNKYIKFWADIERKKQKLLQQQK